MPDDSNKPQDGATNEKPQPEKTAVDTKTSTAVDSGSGNGSDAKTFDAAYVKELRDENAGWRKQVRDLEKRLNEIDSEKQKKVDTELAENQKWKELAEKREKELLEARAERDAERLTNLKQRIGTEFKLSPKLVSRLQGSTEDELRADAKALAEDLGLDKQPPSTPETKPAENAKPDSENPQSRRQTTAVAPDGQPQGETDEQRRARLYQRGAVNSPLFQPRKPV